MGSRKHTKAKEERDFRKGKVISIIYIVILVITFFKVYPYVFDEKIDLNGDNIQYYLLGKSLAQGDGYSDITNPQKPASNRFPPGYPLIISTTMKLISSDINTIKSVNGFFLLASVILLFFLLFLIFKNIHLSFALSVLVLFNSHILSSSFIMMSVIPFMFFSLGALYLLLLLDNRMPFYRNWKFFLMVFLVAYSYHIRTAGLALVGGVALALLIQKQWKYLAGYLVSFTVLCIPWFIRGKLAGTGSAGGYMGLLILKNPYRRELGNMEITDWFARFIKNLERYITHEIPTGVLSFFRVKYNDEILTTEWIVGLLIVSVIIFGLVKLKVSRTIIFSYLLGSFGILLLWPDVWFGVRFIIPIIPVLFVLFAYGIYCVINLILNKFNLKSTFVLQVIIPLAFLISIPLFKPQIDVLHQKTKGKFSPNFQSYFELAIWTKENLPDSTLISCRKPSLFYVYSSRFSTGYKRSIVKEDVIEQFIRQGVDYVVVDELGYSSTARNLVPAMRAYPLKFKKVKQIGKTKTSLYKFRPNLGYWGEWKDGKRSGKGIYTFENGNKFEGEWANSLRNGVGIVTMANGTTVSGVWSNDKMDGKFEIRSKEGKLIEKVLYKDNRRIKTLN